MLALVPVSIREANAFVEQTHRHHQPVKGALFAVAVSKDDAIVGVAIIGIPVARMLNDGWTCEVRRVSTTGEKNACSMLYGAAWRAAKALGYRKCISYILSSEPGTSLKAAGWQCIGERGGGVMAPKEPPPRGYAPVADQDAIRKVCLDRNIYGKP